MQKARLKRRILGRSVIYTAAALCVVGMVIGGRPSVAQNRAEFVPTFSTSPRVKQQFEKLKSLAQTKMWDQWLASYQQLVDDPRDLVVEKDEEFLVGARWQCHQLLANLPAPVKQRYRALYDNEARKLFDKSAADKDAAGMRDLYSRYRFSSHAPRALLWLANHAQDHGRHEWARIAYSRLAKDPGVTPNLLIRYALSAHAAGETAEAGAALDRVRKEYGGQPLQLAGQQVTGAQAADQVAKSLQPVAQPADPQWRSFTGENGDRKWAAGPSGKLKKLWEFSQPLIADQPRYSPYQRVIVGGGLVSRSTFSLLSFPVVVGDRLWVQGQRNITALNLATGKAVWDQQDFVLSPDELASENPEGGRGRGSYSRSAFRSFQAAPSIQGSLLVTRLGMTSGPGAGSRWPADFGIGVLDIRTGRPLWRRVAGGEPRGLYFNIPRLQDNVVVTGVATNKGGITEYNAVALDAATGETLWSTYLGAGSDPLAAVDGSPAAIKDGVVWIESSLYTLNAVDFLTGEIRLVYHYDPGQRPSQGGFNSNPYFTNEPISALALAPRTTVDKKEVNPVVFAPRWGLYVIALDAESGRLLWSTPKAPGGRSAGGVLFGVDAQRAYICGDHIQAIKLADGAPDWTWEAQKVASGDLGYAALAGDRIYMPVEGKLHVLSAADGKEIEKIDALNPEGDSPGYTAVIPLGQKVLLSTRDRVVVFGPAE